jgi:hypothetical protein
MRTFSSYGPVDEHDHFCVKRESLVARCVEQLVAPGERAGGHFFTLWAARQTGKTWLIRQAKARIEREYPDQFIVGEMSVQGVIMQDEEPADRFLTSVPTLFREGFHLKLESPPADWDKLKGLFSRDAGLFDKPVILLIDEFDSLPQKVIDTLVGMFRDLYLKRGEHVLHALALSTTR